MANKKEKKQGLRARFTALPRRRRILLATVSILLALAIVLLSVLLLLPSGRVTLRYGGALLREDAYAYWLACYKYEYLVAYKQLGITDTPSGWEKTDPSSGESYGESFKAAIDREIAMRFAASVLFDKASASLSAQDLAHIEETVREMAEEYTYGLSAKKTLRERYDASVRTVKRVALYEAKYAALLLYRFGEDYSGVFAEEHRAALDAFFRAHYTRYGIIYLSDGENAENILALQADIDNGISESEFAEWEREYSELRASDAPLSEAYPNGIYLYDGMRYDRGLLLELSDEMRSLAAEGDTLTVRNEKGTGSYFIMRYTLDEAPYRSTDEKVQASLTGFAEYAARALYRAELEECLADVSWEREVSDAYTLAGIATEKDFNIVDLMG